MNNGNTTPISSDGRIAEGGNFVGPSDKPTLLHTAPDLDEEVEEDAGQTESGA